MDGPLVFLSCGVTTMPLIPLLAGRFTLVVPYEDTVAHLARRGIRAVEWGAFADAGLRARVAAAAPVLADEWYARLESRAEEVFAGAGRSRGADLLAAVDVMLRRRLAEHLHVLELGRALGRSGRLAAVVTHEDATGLIRAFLAGVRESGVPTVHVPHGVYAEEAVVGADLHGVTHTDVIAVGGPAQRAWFLRRGIPADRIVVTGNPAWDALCVSPAGPRPALGLPPGPVVTVASSWIGGANAYRALTRYDQDRRTRACLAAVAARQALDPTLRLVLKLHPSAPATEAERLGAMAAACGARLDLVARDRLADILAASDVLMTLPSTIAVEALLAGTPVIAVDCLYETGAVLTAPADAAALGATLAHALAGWRESAAFAAEREAFRARYNGPADGRAAERVVRLIEVLAARTVSARRGRTAGADRVGERLACARARIVAGDLAGALLLLDPALAADAGAEDARALWTLRGEALARARRPAEAEASFRTALELGVWGPAHAGLGLLFLERGACEEAEVELRRAAAIDPGSDGAWVGLGVLAALAGRVPEAVRLLTRALAFNPDNVEAQSALRALDGGPWQPADAPALAGAGPATGPAS